VGAPADIVLFAADRIGLQRTELLHDLPAKAARLIQRPLGIEHVIVNGEVLIEAGRQTQARSGRLLRSA
jgi:N-acyl-D-aspartate/D-glutamate deacylase